MAESDCESRDYDQLKRDIFDAIYSGSLHQLAKAIDRGAPLNEVSDEGHDVLGAVMTLNVFKEQRGDILMLLIANGALMNASDDTKNELLHYVVLEAIVDAIKPLSISGAVLGCSEHLSDAVECSGNNLPVLSQLLDCGLLEVDQRSKTGATLLHYACFGLPRLEVIRLLLGRLDPNIPDSDGNTALHELFFMQRHPDLVEEASSLLLKSGADPNIASNDGQTPLMLSVWAPGAFCVLLEGGADTAAVDKNGYSVILKAAAADEACLKALIDRGIDVDKPEGERQFTPIRAAVNYNNKVCVSLLLSSGVDVNSADAEGKTALNQALDRDYSDIVVALEENGAVAANPEAIRQAQADFEQSKKRARNAAMDPVKRAIADKDPSGLDRALTESAEWTSPSGLQSAALYSLSHGDLETFLVLVDHGLDVFLKDDGYSLLHDAVLSDQVAVAQHLIAQGLSIEAQGGGGESLFRMSASSSPEMFSLLKASGMKEIAEQDKKMVNVALIYGRPGMARFFEESGCPFDDALFNDQRFLSETIRREETDTLEFLIKKGLDLETTLSIYGNQATLLHYALLIKAQNVVRFLVGHGANVKAVNSGGDSVLRNAIESHDEPSVKLLLDKGADPNEVVGMQKVSLLQTAIRNGESRIARLVLSMDVNVNFTGGIPGSTALHDAAERGFLQAIEIMVSKGGDVNIEDSSGRKPLDVAIECENIAVSEYLRPITVS